LQNNVRETIVMTETTQNGFDLQTTYLRKYSWMRLSIFIE